MADGVRWTEESASRLRYNPADDRRGQGNYYVWEGGTGFGARLYRSGRRTYVCASTVTNRQTGKPTPRFFTVGVIGDIPIKEARNAAVVLLTDMRSGKDPRGAADRSAGGEVAEGRTKLLANITVKEALIFYGENRNCAPRSKKDLKSTLHANIADWMEKRLFGICPKMLHERYRDIIKRVKAEAAEREARYAELSPEKRLLAATPGYFHGEKGALDTIKGFARIYRYYVKMHSRQLAEEGFLPPACPILALEDDLLPEAQRVKGMLWSELKTLVDSFPTYRGNRLHTLLARLLLATGRRVGVLMSCKKSYILPDRIAIPGSSERTKVKWRNRHLDHYTLTIPRTPEIDEILKEIESVASDYGDATLWLFPSPESESGHMEEERAITKGLRKHARVRFNVHQFRHNFATAAEELGWTLTEIGELLGQYPRQVTQRYIDERIKRQRRQLIAVGRKMRALMNESARSGNHRSSTFVSPLPQPNTSC